MSGERKKLSKEKLLKRFKAFRADVHMLADIEGRVLAKVEIQALKEIEAKLTQQKPEKHLLLQGRAYGKVTALIERLKKEGIKVVEVKEQKLKIDDMEKYILEKAERFMLNCPGIIARHYESMIEFVKKFIIQTIGDVRGGGKIAEEAQPISKRNLKKSLGKKNRKNRGKRRSK